MNTQKPQISIISIQSLNELEKYREPIVQLEMKIKDLELFTSFKWLNSWLNIFKQNSEFNLLLFFQEDRLVAILPILSTQQTYLKIPVIRLELISINHHGNIVKIPALIDAEILWIKVFDYLQKCNWQWDFLYLEGILEKDTDIPKIVSASGKSGLSAYHGDLFQILYDWILPIDSDWENYYQGLSKNVKKSLNNRRNQLKRIGGFNVEHYENPSQFEYFMQQVEQVDSKSWQYAENCGLSSAKNVQFYRRLAEDFKTDGLDIWILKINDQPAAFEYSIIYNNKIYGLRWGYDQAFHRFSPGKVLRAESLKYYFEKGFREYCMMGKYPEFKKMWGAQPHKATDVIIWNKTAKGRLINFFGFKLGLHKLKIRLRGI